MKSFLSGNNKITDKKRENSRQISLSTLFNLFLGCFFIFQVVIGFFVISSFIGNEMSKMQLTYIERELDSHKQAVDSYLKDRLAVLEDYSKLSAIIAGTLNPSANQANTVDFINELSMLKENVSFCLQDFEGKLIYANSKVAEEHFPTGINFQLLMDEEKKDLVKIIKTSDGDIQSHYWSLSLAVRYQNLTEGVFTALIPLSLDAFFTQVDSENFRASIIENGKSIASRGEAPPPAITYQVDTKYPNIGLTLEVSKQNINQKIQYLITQLILALIIGTLLLMGIMHLLGRKMFLVPHAKLQSMTDSLEEEVAWRTKDLQSRTDQLSTEIKVRREAELEAQERGQLVSTLLEGIEAAFFIINPSSGNVVRSNSVVRKMFGLSAKQILEKSCIEKFPKSSDFSSDILCPSSIEGNAYTEGIVHNADGQTFPVSRYLVPIYIRGQKHIGVLLLDITARKNLERKLTMAQKLESIGRLASGVAHEINTPIQYIGDSVQFIKEAFDDFLKLSKIEKKILDSCRRLGGFEEIMNKRDKVAADEDTDFIMNEIPEACTRALEGVERVATIVRAMKNFSHPGESSKQLTDINKAITTTLTVARNEWKYAAEVDLQLEDIPMIMTLQGDINQVLLNMIVNAAHAIQDKYEALGKKGEIIIATTSGDGFVAIKISDNGTGISPEILDNIFDPFFTTKKVGEGTGQGLALVHDSIVNKHSGSVDVESKPGVGTTFTIHLPLDQHSS